MTLDRRLCRPLYARCIARFAVRRRRSAHDAAMTTTTTTKRFLLGGLGLLMMAAPLAIAAAPAGAAGTPQQRPQWSPAPTVSLTTSHGPGYGIISGSEFTPNGRVIIRIWLKSVGSSVWVEQQHIAVTASSGEIDCFDYQGCERIDGTISTTEAADNGYVLIQALDLSSGKWSNLASTFVLGQY